MNETIKGTLQALREHYLTEMYVVPGVKTSWSGNAFWMHDWIQIESKLPSYMKLQEKWCDGPYRGVWTADDVRAVFTFCEGDLTLSIFDSDEAYATARAEMKDFYEGGC